MRLFLIVLAFLALLLPILPAHAGKKTVILGGAAGLCAKSAACRGIVTKPIKNLGKKALEKGVEIAKEKAKEAAKDLAAAYIDPSRYPAVAGHVREAIGKGHPDILTHDPKNARKNRRDSLRGIPTAPKMQRDEYPFASTKEGGKGASVKSVPEADNMGCGSAVMHQCRKQGVKPGDQYRVVVGEPPDHLKPKHLRKRK